MNPSLHVARWVLPIVLGVVLFLPGPCVSGTADCPANADCGTQTTTCYSVVGIPTNGAVAAVGIPVVVLVAAAARQLVADRRARSEQGLTQQ